MTAINYGTSGNTDRCHSVADSPLLDLPNGNWLLYFAYQSGANPNFPYIYSHGGTYGTIDSIQVFQNASKQIVGKVNALTDVNWGGGSVVQGDNIAGYLTRRNNALYIGGGYFNAPQTVNEGGGTSITSGYSPTGAAQIGLRSDLTTSAQYAINGIIFDVIFVPGYSMTANALRRILAGEALYKQDWWNNRKLHAHVPSADYPQLYDLTGNHVITRNGTGYSTDAADEPKILRVPPRADKWKEFVFMGGAIGAALDGDITCVSTVTGDLTTAITLDGGITCVTTVNGTLTAGTGLSGGIDCVATVAGDLTTAITLDGDITCISTVGGALTTGTGISGTISCVATVAGDLTAGPAPIELSGDITCVSTITGDLTTAITLAGSINCISTVSGTLFELAELIITMAARAQGRKKSDFLALNNIPADATFDFVSQGTNYKIPLIDFLTSLNVTGTIVQDGDPTGTPVLDPQGTVHNIRNIEAGAGIFAGVSPQNGLTLTHNFKTGTGGAPILTGLTDTQPQIGNIIGGTGITVTAVTGGVEISLT